MVASVGVGEDERITRHKRRHHAEQSLILFTELTNLYRRSSRLYDISLRCMIYA